MNDDLLEVVVSRNLGGTKVRLPVSALDGLHMTNSAGGTGARLPRTTLAAYIWCSSIPDDYWSAFGHSCSHGPPPHRIKVVIPRGANSRVVYEKLLELAT